MNFEYIDLKRREQNLTVTALCAAAEIDRGTYVKFKKNPKAIRLTTFEKICEALNLSKEEKAQAIM